MADQHADLGYHNDPKSTGGYAQAGQTDYATQGASAPHPTSGPGVAGDTGYPNDGHGGIGS